MAKIPSCEECEGLEKCAQCPYPCDGDLGASKETCSKCLAHCPCCAGPDDGFCDQCAEEDCGNRNKPYNPNAISYEE